MDGAILRAPSPIPGHIARRGPRKRDRGRWRPSGPSRSSSPAPPRARCIGDRIIAHAGGLRWLTLGRGTSPAAGSGHFAGPTKDVVLAASLELAPDAELRIDSAFVGRGGVTADVALEAGSLAGFAFTLDSLYSTGRPDERSPARCRCRSSSTLCPRRGESSATAAYAEPGRPRTGRARELAVLGPGHAGPRARRLTATRSCSPVDGSRSRQAPPGSGRSSRCRRRRHGRAASRRRLARGSSGSTLRVRDRHLTPSGFGTEDAALVRVDGSPSSCRPGAACGTARYLGPGTARVSQLTLDGIGVTFGVPRVRLHGRGWLTTRTVMGKAVHGRARARPRRARRRDRRGHHDCGRHASRCSSISALRCRSPWQRPAQPSTASRGLFAMNMAPLVATGAVDGGWLDGPAGGTDAVILSLSRSPTRRRGSPSIGAGRLAPV